MQRGDRDIAAGFDRQAVEALVAAKAGDDPPAMRRRPALLRHHARRGDVERPEPRGFGVGDVQHLAVGGEAAAVGAEDRIRHLDDLRAVRQRVVEAAMVARARVALAEIGEIEAAVGVEHQVVRRRQLVAVAVRVEHARVAGLRIDALDAAAVVVVRGADRHPVARRILAAAVVAQIERAVGADREAVGSAAGIADGGTRAVGADAGAASTGDLGEDDRAVRHHHGAFREAEVARHDPHVRHCPFLPLVWRYYLMRRVTLRQVRGLGLFPTISSTARRQLISRRQEEPGSVGSRLPSCD